MFSEFQTFNLFFQNLRIHENQKNGFLKNQTILDFLNSHILKKKNQDF